MDTIVQDIFQQFNHLNDEEQRDFIIKLKNTQQEKSWYDLLDDLSVVDISDDDITAEVESVRANRYNKSMAR